MSMWCNSILQKKTKIHISLSCDEFKQQEEFLTPPSSDLFPDLNALIDNLCLEQSSAAKHPEYVN